MKINIKKVKKDGKYLELYAKKPFFMDFKLFHKQIDNYFKDEDNFLNVGIDITGKYAILTFILRNKEDILPYINFMNKTNELEGNDKE